MYTEPGTSISTSKIRPLQQLGIRKLTHAHLALSRRQGLVQQLVASTSGMAQVLSKALGQPFQLSGQLLPSAMPTGRALSHGGVYVLGQLDAIGAPVVLEAEAGFCSHLVGRLAGAEDSEVPTLRLTRVEETAVGYLILLAIAELRRRPEAESLWAPRLHGVTGIRQEALEHLGQGEALVVELKVQLGARGALVRLVLPAAALHGPVSASALDPVPPLRPELAGAPVALACCAQAIRLPSGELDALVPQDVLLLEGLTVEKGQIAGISGLVGLGLCLQGELVPDGFRLAEVKLNALSPELPMPKSHTANQDPTVEIQVELARLQIPLGELGLLDAGMVFPLHVLPTTPVRLRIGERTFARAELVDIEGQVGARILELIG